MLSQNIETGKPGLHEQFEYQSEHGDAVMFHIPVGFENSSDYLDIFFEGGLYAAINVYVDEDLGN